MPESKRRMIEILRILNNQEKPTGSKLIATELKNKGFNLGERAVRYHMQILDEKGYTEKIGYSGRQITDLGREKLEKGLIYDRVDFIYSKFQEMIYLTDFDYTTKTGNVVINTSTVYDKSTLKLVKNAFDSGLCVSPYIKFKKINNEKYNIATVCGTTIDGILLNEGILTIPLYEGLLKIEDLRPTKFIELISYKKTSIPPLDAFIVKGMTSVSDVIEAGEGVIPANFRVIPVDAKDKLQSIVKKLKKIGIGGVLAIGEEGENTLGIPVKEGMIGMGIIGGVTPFCVAQEANHKIDIKIDEEIEDFDNLKTLNINKTVLNPPVKNNYKETPFILSKMWNQIEKVDFDMKTEKGKIISNISLVDKDDVEKVLQIMEETYNQNPKYINPFYKVVEHPTDDNKIGIGTICSLSIDGILIKNGIMCNPRYGGLLELSKPPLFIELISYNGFSIDPHKVFIAKGLVSNNKSIGPDRILASIKEIPYIARDYAVKTLKNLKTKGFSIYKIGKPRELIYNAKVNNYNFGIVTGSGLNQISAIKEENINIDVKAMEMTIPFEEMNRF